MAKIRTLQIERYQSHKCTVLDLHPNVNVILGQSDVGKSSIIRSLNWVATNRPMGDSFLMNQGKGETEVAIEMDDEQYVMRTKGNKTNSYNANGVEYKALRSDVPEEVQSLLNMEEVNIQPQHEMYFMLGESPGQIAKRFNKVAGLEEMDEALKKANSMVRDTTSKMDFLLKSIEEKEEAHAELEWTESAEESLGEIEELLCQQQQLRTERDTAQNTIASVFAAQEAIGKLPPKEAFPSVIRILSYYEEFQEVDELAQEIQRICNTLAAVEKELKQCNVYDADSLRGTEQVRADYDALERRQQQIEQQIEKIKQFTIDLVASDLEVKAHSDVCDEIESQCEYCETCGQLITEGK